MGKDGHEGTNYVVFSLKKFGVSDFFRTFALPEPAKPLNDAQMCGSFFLYRYGQTTF